MQIKPYDIFGDYYHTLLDEYNNEDKHHYKQLFNQYFPHFDNSLRMNDFASMPILVDNTHICLKIIVFQGEDVYKPYFTFNVESLDLEPLKILPQTRELVKLCIYISEMSVN